MSVENVICKDDNSGEARVFIENGTPPFIFIWNTGVSLLIMNRQRLKICTLEHIQ